MKKTIILALLLVLSGLYLSAQALRVGIYDNPPKIFVNSHGKPDGIFVDILEEIARKEEFQLQYVSEDWHVLLQMLEAGEIDILPDVAYSLQRDSLFKLNKLSVLNSWLYGFTLKSHSIESMEDLHNLRIGVLKGSIQHHYFENDIKNDFKLDFELKPMSAFSELLNALREGTIDIFIADRFFYFSESCKEDIIPTGIILRPTELYFAFPQSTPNSFIEKFDQEISILKNEPQSIYYRSIQKWFNKDDFFRIPPYILWLISIIILILMISILFASLLKHRVTQKTKELSQRNKDLQIALQKVDESDRLKTVFLQNISHEIRTPLNGIIGFSQLLSEESLSEAEKENYVKIIRESSNRLTETIHDIIELSKIQAGQIEIRKSEIYIADFLAIQYNFLREQCDNNLVKCKARPISTNEFTVIQSDFDKLSTIFQKLILNALKFTHQGEIEVGAFYSNNQLHLYVKDTGLGIEASRLQAIFEPFVHANLDTSRGHEGLGIGLSIASAYANLLDGKISAESEPGIGSNFMLSLPLNI